MVPLLSKAPEFKTATEELKTFVEEESSQYDGVVVRYVERGAADIGVAGGDGCGLIFKKGEILRKVPEEKIVEEFLSEIEKMQVQDK